MDAKKAFEIPELLTLGGRAVTGPGNDDDEQVWSCGSGCDNGGAPPAPKPTQPAPQG